MQKLCFDTKLAKKPNFSDFETISRFFYSFILDSISNLKIIKIHENCALDSFQAPEVNRRKSESGARKLKISKCSILNQILGEGCIWLVKVLHGLISSINLLHNYLFMIQVNNMLFPESWIRTIQAPPNSVWWPPNSRSLTLCLPNMFGKPIKLIHNQINHFFSLILHLPVNSFLWFTMKNNEFHR